VALSSAVVRLCVCVCLPTEIYNHHFLHTHTQSYVYYNLYMRTFIISFGFTLKCRRSLDMRPTKFFHDAVKCREDLKCFISSTKRNFFFSFLSFPFFNFYSIQGHYRLLTPRIIHWWWLFFKKENLAGVLNFFQNFWRGKISKFFGATFKRH
jgi:hypothetical protein